MTRQFLQKLEDFETLGTVRVTLGTRLYIAYNNISCWESSTWFDYAAAQKVFKTVQSC
jgi:hypothetical protein